MKISKLITVLSAVFYMQLAFTAEAQEVPKEGCAFETAGLCLTAAAGVLSHATPNDGTSTKFRVVAVLHGPIKTKWQKRWGFMVAPGEDDFIDAVGTGLSWGFSDPFAVSGGVLTAHIGVLAKFYKDAATGKDSTEAGGYFLVSQSF